MNRPYRLLSTRLVYPRVKSQYLQRPRLERLLWQAVDYPVTVVHAEAGYGKSTALAAHLCSHFEPVAWYSVEEGDWDAFQFLSYLIAALKAFDERIGERALGLLQEADSAVAVWRPCMTMLINDLAELAPDPSILILDDLHTVAGATEIESVLDWLIRYLPAHVHLVIGTRRALQLPSLQRLQATCDLLLIGKQELAFSVEEIDRLFVEQYGIQLTGGQLRLLHEQTEGWIIALQMVWKGLERGVRLDDLWKPQPETGRRLFHYLAEEVFDRQPERIRQFLLRTAILQSMEPDICRLLTGESDPPGLLAQLEQDGLFVAGDGFGHYRYHRLFQQFLISHLLLNGSEQQWFVLHRKAADFYREKGDIPAALHHFYEAQDRQAVVHLLLQAGEEFLQNGRLELLKIWIERLDGEVLQQYPQFLFWRGEIDRVSSRFSEAGHWYTLAEGGFIRLGDALGRSRVYRGQAQLYLDTIQPAKANDWLEKAAAVLDDAYPLETARLLRLIAENHTNSGRLHEAQEVQRRANELAPGAPKDELDIRIHLRTGRLAQAHQLARQILEDERREPERARKRTAKSHRETHLLLALIDAFMGDAASSRWNAAQGIRVGQELQSPFVEAVGYIRLGHAFALAGRLAKAADSYRRSMQISEQLDVERGKVEALMGLCITAGLAGELGKAEQYARDGLQLALAVQDMWSANLIRLALGLVQTTWGQYEEALPRLLEAEQGFAACGDRFCLANVWLWMAILYEKIRDERELARVLPLLLETVGAGGYDFCFEKRTLFGPDDLQMVVPALLWARDRLQRRDAGKLLGLLGCKDVQKHPGYTLRICTLGKFSVHRGLEEVARKEWKRDKSRQLFQLLVTRRGQFLQREEIFELLWPDADEKTAARDFKVALNALITALEPEREARAESFFIERLDSAYRLRLGRAVWIDRDEFEACAEKGLTLADNGPAAGGDRSAAGDASRAFDELEAAMLLYKGDFLQDYPYQEWCAEERERLRILHLQVLEKMALLHQENGALAEAIDCCERILAIDPCWEAAYQILMTCYYQQGNRNLVIAAYKRCAAQLEEQLGLAPMPETTRLYQQLIRRRA